MNARVVVAAIGLAGPGAGAARGDPPRTARATEMRGQAGAAIGLGSFDQLYAPEFGALLLTAHGGVLLGRGVGVGVGVRATYFHGGETTDGGVVMLPTYEATRVPVVLTGRIQGRYAFAELGVGTTPSWIVDGQGQTVRGPSDEALAFTAGLTTRDPTLRYHPELIGGVVQIGDARLWWIGAGLAWW